MRVMNAQKTVSVLMLCLAISVPVYTAGKGEADATLHEKGAIIMKIAHAQPVTHPRHKSLLLFKRLVETRTNGAIHVWIFPAGQLGGEADMQDATREGRLEATRGGLFERISPRLLVYTLPFLFDGPGDIAAVTAGPVGKRIAASAELYGFKILAMGDAGGFRQITNSVRPITAPDDLKGLRIRTPAVQTNVKTFQQFGAEVIVLPYGETYAALRDGIVEGQENPCINILSMKFYETQKYLTILDYQYHPDPFVVNLEWFNALPQQWQTILTECASQSMKYNDELVRSEETTALEILSNAMEVRTLTVSERDAFRRRVSRVYDYLVDEGITTFEELDEIRSETKRRKP